MKQFMAKIAYPVYEWFQGFQSGREDINDDQQVGQSKSVITGNSVESVCEFIKNQPKSSLKFMEMELNISKTLICHYILCARFVPHKVTDDKNCSEPNIRRTSLKKAPCDFFLFGKMHLPMKGKSYVDVGAIQKACTGILAAIPTNELKHSFDMLLDRAKNCIEAGGDYFE